MWTTNIRHCLTKLGITLPIIQAPMAGGPTTPELVAAVSNAGGLGSIGAAMLAPEALQTAIQATRQLTQKPFAVNLFAPLQFERSAEKIQLIWQAMAGYRQELGLPPTAQPEIINPAVFEDQLAMLIREKIKLISFTFGTPSQQVINQLHDHKIIVMGTATTVQEAITLAEMGYDMIIAQGSEAGGHRGTFLNTFESSLIGTMALVPQIVDYVKIPVIAAGGIMDGRGLAAALCLGASAAQIGTAFLTCPEAGIHPKYKEAILQSTEQSTAITAVFSGRPARAIRNRFSEEMQKYKEALPDYPVQQSLTLPIRKKAAEANRTEFLSLWAGQGTRLNQTKPAAQLTQEIAEQAWQLLQEIVSNSNS